MQRWHDTPAIVQNRYGDVLACTGLALAIHPSLAHDRNLVRLLTLLASHAATTFTDHVNAPRDVVVVDRPR